MQDKISNKSVNTKKIKPSVIIIAIFTVTLGYCYTAILPDKINIDQYRNYIINQTEAQIKYRVNLGKLTLELPLTGGAVIKSNKLTVTRRNGERLVSADNVEIKVALIPLITSTLVIKDAKADNLQAIFIRKSSGKVDIEEVIKILQSSKDFIVKFSGTKGKINNYRITFLDKYVKPAQTHLFEGKNIEILNLTDKKTLSFRLNGIKDKHTEYYIRTNIKLPAKKDLFANNYSIEGEVKNFNLTELKPYTDFKNLTGSLNTNFKLNQSHETLRAYTKTEITNKISLPKYNLQYNDGTLEAKIEADRDQLNIISLNSTVNKVNANINGSINKWQSKHPGFDITINSNGFDIKDLSNSIPPVKELNNTVAMLKHYKINGLTILNINFKGNLKHPQLFGNLNLNKYSLNLNNRLTLNNINGDFNFYKNTITLNNFNIPVSKSQYLLFNGNYNFIDNSFKDFKVISNAVDLKNYQAIILSIPQIADTMPEIIKTSVFNGENTIDIILNGNLNKPLINGKMIFNAKTVKIAGYQQPIQNLSGKLLFENKKALIKDLNLNISKNNKVIISVKYDFYNSIIDYITLNANNINLNELQSVLLSLYSGTNSPFNPLKDFIINGKSTLNITAKGDFKNPDINGMLSLIDVNILNKVKKLSITDINGSININNALKTDNLRAMIENNPVFISTNMDLKGNGLVKVRIPEFKLASIRDLALKSKTLNSTDTLLLKQTRINGYISGDINTRLVNGKVTPSALLQIHPGSIYHPSLGNTFNLQKGLIGLTNDNVEIKNLCLSSNKSIFTLSGTLNHLSQKVPDYNIKFSGNNINSEIIHQMGKGKSMPADMRDLISSLIKTTGNASIAIDITNKSFSLTTTFKDYNVYTKRLSEPIKDLNGSITISKTELGLNNLSFGYGTSGLAIHGKLTQLEKDPHLNIMADGHISPTDFNEFLAEEINKNLEFTEPAEFNARINGSFKDWDMIINASIPESASISYKGVFQRPVNTTSTITLDARGNMESFHIREASIQLGQSKITANGSAKLSYENIADLENININTPIINLYQLNEFIAPGLLPYNLAGTIQSDVKINGAMSSPEIFGNILFNDVSLPMFAARNGNGEVILNGKSGELKNFNININNMIFNLSGHISDLNRFPVELTNLKLSSPSVTLSEIFNAVNSSARTNTGLGSSITPPPLLFALPVTVKNGKVTFQEAILDKLITNNLTATIILGENGLLQLNNLELNTAGGRAKGNIYLNLLSNRFGAQLKIMGIKANAAATVLLDLPNEVFGDLNGVLSFDTMGTEYEEALENAQGKASLEIYNGRFTRLGTLEHLLTATNIIGSGITGISLNNIFGALIPMHTGSFEVLEGNFTVKDGILSTSNLSSRGKNLSLELDGRYNIVSEMADLTIKGKISKHVSGLLGPLGKLNISTITDFIPGLGFMPGFKKKRKGLLSFIPFLSFIPGFGGGGSGKVRTFTVDMKGKIYDMAAVKNFRWTN